MDIQIDMFADTEVDRLKTHIDLVEKGLGNIRRGLFARHNDLAKLYYEQQEEHEQIKRDIEYLKAALIQQEPFVRSA